MARRAVDLLNGQKESRDVDSLNRGLEILRTFCPHEGPLDAGELSERLGIPRATVIRLADTLVAQGFLRRLPDGARYVPDSSCLVLGHALLSSSVIVRVARPALERFAEENGAHIILAVRERLCMLTLAYSTPRKADPLRELEVGMMLPLTASAVGRAWLWAQAATYQGELIQRARLEGGGDVARTIPGLYRAFQELEERGFCGPSSDWLRYLYSYGAPLMLPNGQSYGLSCALVAPPSKRDQLRVKLGDALVAAAAQIRDNWTKRAA